MFGYIIRKIRFWGSLFKTNKRQEPEKKPAEKIPKSIDKVVSSLEHTFFNCSNLIRRQITVKGRKLLITFIEDLISYDRLELGILKPILEFENQKANKDIDIEQFKNKLILPCKLIEISDMQSAVELMFNSHVILFLDKEDIALGISIEGFNERDIQTPVLESTVRGPKEGFVESASVNLSLLTKVIKSPDLKSEQIKLGNRTNTKVFVCYLGSVAKKEIVDEVKQRIAKINIDAVLDINFVGEFIGDNPYTVFPLAGSHERPDVVAAQILEGRVAILCDGAPMALTVPFLFSETIQNSEDYFNKPFFATILRMIRVFSFLLTMLLPSFYIAFLNFHHEVMPYDLLITAAAGQERIPLDTMLEVLLMLVSFEMIREASMRMPRGIGQTVSIVGALILGDAAVKAGFVSNLVVIVIALTAITSFINSGLLDTVSILRLGYIFAATVFGLCGIIMFSALLLFHMCSLTSFSVPYMSPLSPWDASGMKDTFIRTALKNMKNRPKGIAQDIPRRGNES
ncbi:MAG: spore germination protein [Bacillota bacterium]